MHVFFTQAFNSLPRVGKLRAVTSQAYSATILALLAVMAGLLIYTATGGQVPRVAFAALILAQAVLRALRDRSNPSARNRNFVQLLIAVGIAYLIATNG